MDPDPWVTCPYDKVHRVPQSRLQGHIIKCEKRYPKLAICPYNATHRNRVLFKYPTVCNGMNLPNLFAQKMGPLILRQAMFHSKYSLRMSDEELTKHVKTCSSRQALFPDKPHERSNCPSQSTHGAIYTPKPFLQKDILPETDPDHEIWDD